MGIKHATPVTGPNDPAKQVSVTAWNQDHVLIGVLQLGELDTDPLAPANGGIWLNTTTGEVKVRTAGATLPLGAGGGATDLSYTAASRLLASSTGADVTLPLVGADAGLMAAADKTKLDGIATGAQVNVATDLSYTAASRLLASSTGADVTLPLVGADAGLMTAADKTKLDGIATGAQVNVATDLSYTAATRLLASSTGADVTLPLVGADAGLMTAADKTKLDGIATGAQVNVATDLSYTAATRLLASSTGADVTLPLVGADAGLMTAADKTKLDGISAGATPNATHTGDATGATALTLATVNANVGSFGLAASVAQFTVNAKGLITAVANLAISIAATAISDSTAAGRAMLTAATAAAQTALLDVCTATLKGLVPPPGTASGLFLRDDITWAAASGGSGSPGGSSGEIQWNNAGAFAGAADVEIEGGQLRLPAISVPAAPAAGGLKLFSRSLAGRLLAAIIGPAGIDTTLQVSLHANSVIVIAPASGTTAPTIFGGTLTTAATMSLQYTAGSTNKWASTQRKRFQTTTTAGNATGMRLAYTHCHRGNAAGFGGFFFRAQLGMQINLNGGQKFVGLCASTGALAAEPSALVNMCGMGYDAADASTGNWFFMRNDASGTATKVDLGANAARNATDGFDLIMFMAPNGSDLFVRITNINTGVVVLDTSYNTDLPAVNTGLCLKAEVRNGAVAAADNLEVAKVYIETDY